MAYMGVQYSRGSSLRTLWRHLGEMVNSPNFLLLNQQTPLSQVTVPTLTVHLGLHSVQPSLEPIVGLRVETLN